MQPEPRMAVWKFELGLDSKIKMPIGAKVLHVDKQADRLYLWAQVDTKALLEERFFTVIMTGEKFHTKDEYYFNQPELVGEYNLTHVGTVVGFKNWLVVHVYEGHKITI